MSQEKFGDKHFSQTRAKAFSDVYGLPKAKDKLYPHSLDRKETNRSSSLNIDEDDISENPKDLSKINGTNEMDEVNFTNKVIKYA